MKTWTCLLLALAGCQPRFIPDAGYRAQVERDFKERQALLPGDLFAVFDAPMTPREREAMRFLYAYSPLVDLATLDGTFFLENTRAAFRAREEMPWGKEIPDEIFRHFVLPPRGGKETLDPARLVFYRELKARAGRHATIEAAALEVNHWCHEKVIYRPTNARTMSPLATASVAYGRCGEESIFTLAALRAVCIPARQVYTPRWAHCDDNHAWIEVWAGGAWKYLGACEPEPRLDIAWFTLPVQRAVYVEAEVFGRYEAAGEEIVLADRSGSKVNVTARYTRAKPARVKVVDRQGRPVAGARVEYRVFNYGEFHPVVTLRADGRGESRLTLGEGDLLVWASHAGTYGFAKLPVASPDSLTLTLDKEAAATYALAYDLVPPAESPVEALSTVAEREENDRRLLEEDAIREAYIATFIPGEEAARVAAGLGVDPARLARLATSARGNAPVVLDFVRGLPAARREVALALLEILPEKDLQDTPLEVLRDHLTRAWPYREHPLFTEYILNPRVQNEQLTAYRAPLQAHAAAGDIRSVAGWVAELDRVPRVDTLYRDRIVTPPVGVLRARAVNAPSAEVFLVAACRSTGIPARLDPVTGKAEYFDDDRWRPATGEPGTPAVATGALLLRHDGSVVKDPLYYLHFTISKVENGTTRTIDMGSNADVDMGAGASLRQIFAAPARLEAGDYILTTGNRRADGSVLAGITSFRVRAGETTGMNLSLQPADETLNVLGKTAPAIPYHSLDRPETLLPPARGYAAVAIIEANKEPSNHLLRDIAALKEEFEAAGQPLCLLFDSREGLQSFSPAAFRPFPSTMITGHDDGHRLLQRLAADLSLDHANLPLLLLLNREGEVVFLSRGYRIGLGAQIIRIMTRPRTS